MSKETHSQGSNSEKDTVKIWEEMDQIEPLTPILKKEKETKLCIEAYKEAALYDDYMFGNIDYLDSWIGIATDKK